MSKVKYYYDSETLSYRKIEKKKATIVAERLPVIHSNRIALNQVFQNLILRMLMKSVTGESLQTMPTF